VTGFREEGVPVEKGKGTMAHIVHPASWMIKEKMQTSIWNLVSAWVLMIPLLYLAGHGSFFFQHTLGNSVLDNSRLVGDTRTATEHAQGQAAIVFAILVTLGLMAPSFSSILALWRLHLRFSALVILAIISVAWSNEPMLSIVGAIYLTINLCFAFHLGIALSAERQKQAVMMLGWIAIMLSIALALWFPSVGIDNKEGVAAWQGISVQKNSCAVIMIYLFSPVLFLAKRGGLHRVSKLLYSAGCVFVIAMTQSRTGWIGIFALAGFWVAWRTTMAFASRDRAFVITMLTVSSAAVVSAVVLYLPALLMAMGKEATLTGRTTLWSLVITVAMKHPLLGFGYNAFWNSGQVDAQSIALFLRWTPNHAHNGFLDVWLQLGAVGLALMLWTLVRAFRDGAACMQSQDRGTAGWYLAIIVITIITNLDERSIMYPNFLEWVMYIMACVGLMNEARRLKAARTMEEVAA
jgi:exopolysaccharide production protein ExoQ